MWSLDGQASYVRGDDWLTPVTLDERSAAYRGAMPSKTGKRASDKGFLAFRQDLQTCRGDTEVACSRSEPSRTERLSNGRIALACVT